MALVFVSGRLELCHLPFVVDGFETLLDLVLLGGRLGHLVYEAGVLLKVKVDDHLECERVGVLLELLIRLVLHTRFTNKLRNASTTNLFKASNRLKSYLDLIPMALSHRLVVQVVDQRHGASESVHFALGHLDNVPVFLL